MYLVHCVYLTSRSFGSEQHIYALFSFTFSRAAPLFHTKSHSLRRCLHYSFMSILPYLFFSATVCYRCICMCLCMSVCLCERFLFNKFMLVHENIWLYHVKFGYSITYMSNNIITTKYMCSVCVFNVLHRNNSGFLHRNLVWFDNL